MKWCTCRLEFKEERLCVVQCNRGREQIFTLSKLRVDHGLGQTVET